MNNLRAALHRPIDATCVLDLETYRDRKYGLRVGPATVEAYVRDPRWQIIGVGVKWNNAPAVWLEEGQFRAWAKRVSWKRVALVCHNAQFDAFALNHHYGISPGLLTCTMSIPRALGHFKVGLGALAPLYGFGEKGDAVEEFIGMRRRDFTRDQWLRFGAYCCNDVDLTAKLFAEFKKRLPWREFYILDQNLRAFTEPVFRGDVPLLERELAGERERKSKFLADVAKKYGIKVEKGQDSLEAAREILSSTAKLAELLRGMGVDVPTKLGKKGMIPAFAKSDPGMQDLLDYDGFEDAKQNERVQFLAQASLAVSSTLVETRTERLLNIARRGPVPFYYKYCGAHTHRLSGGDRMNPQNFNRGGALRDSILSPPGYVLVVTDSGQIEARFVGWFAGETWLLDAFRRNDNKTLAFNAVLQERSGKKVYEIPEDELKEWTAKLERDDGLEPGDFYSDVGSTFFGRKISKAVDKALRQLSKSMVLGLGYGMAFLTFAINLLKGGPGVPPKQFTEEDARKYGVNPKEFWDELPSDTQARVRDTPMRLELRDFIIHCAVSDYFVRVYRQKNPRIAKSWKDAGRVLEVMAEEGDPDKVRMRFGCLQVKRHALVKPSGMVLHYPGLAKRKNKWGKWEFTYLNGKKGGHERGKIYGSSLIENIVQSLARDCIMEQSLWIEASGRPVKASTHDEAAAVTVTADGPAAYEASVEALMRPPSWCPDIPLFAEGGFGSSYGAVK